MDNGNEDQIEMGGAPDPSTFLVRRGGKQNSKLGFAMSTEHVDL